jgi:proteasome accessory factor B
VGLAARLWQSATLGQAASTATQKLHAAGMTVEVPSTPGLVPIIDTADPNLDVLFEAARNNQVVSFAYQKVGAADAEMRVVEPWGVLSWHRRWYVVGLDRGREQARSFRLSRIHGSVKLDKRAVARPRPEGVDLLGMVSARPPEATSVARVRVSEGAAGQLRRLADSETEGVLTITYSDLPYLAHRVASAGRGATVLEPPELADAVRDQLLAVLGEQP